MIVDQLSSSSTIYLEQLKLYFIGYNTYSSIRSRLLNDLNKNIDELLMSPLIDLFRFYLLSENINMVDRALQVLEECVSYAEQVMTAALNTKENCGILKVLAKRKKILTFHTSQWDRIRLHAAGMYLFWFKTYYNRREQCNFLLQKYEELVKDGVSFPKEPFIEVRQCFIFKKNESQSEELTQALRFIRTGISNSQRQFEKDKRQCLTNQFVRPLKAHAKKLYAISGGSHGLLSQQDAEECQFLYRKVRNLLKDVDAANNQIINQKNIKKETEFVKHKMSQIGNKTMVKAISPCIIQGEKNQNAAKPAAQLANKSHIVGEIQANQTNSDTLSRYQKYQGNYMSPTKNVSPQAKNEENSSGSIDSPSILRKKQERQLGKDDELPEAIFVQNRELVDSDEST